MKRAAALAALALMAVAPAAHATAFRHPSTCHAGCMVVTAYYDYGGVKDWNCGGNTYSGHKGTDFAIYGKFTAMDEGRDIVAAADGDVTYVHDGEFDRCTTGSCGGGGGFGNWVRVKHADGKESIYGHMKQGTVAVKVGDEVTCGQRLGQVGSSGNSTGPHLHFEPRVSGTADDPFGKGACSGPLSYWVDQGAYEALPGTACETPPPPPPPENKEPKGSFDSADCSTLRGWAQDPDDPTKPLDVHLTFDGEAGSGAKAIVVKANLSRADLCGPLGSCEHAFEVAPPTELLDGKEHTIFAYAIDLAGGTNPKLPGSPRAITCAPPEADAGIDDASADDAGADDAAIDAAGPADASEPAAALDGDGALRGSCGCRFGARRPSFGAALVALGIVALRRRRSNPRTRA